MVWFTYSSPPPPPIVCPLQKLAKITIKSEQSLHLSVHTKYGELESHDSHKLQFKYHTSHAKVASGKDSGTGKHNVYKTH